jgi:septal ring factor EnvC (AmiA/AmiB activator)
MGEFATSRAKRCGRVVVAVCTVLLVSTAAPSAQEKDLDERIKDNDSELKKLRKSIAEQRSMIREVEKKEKRETEYLKKLEEEETLTRRLLEGLEEKGDLLGEQMTNLETDLEANAQVYRHRLGVLAGRLREMYKEGPKKIWQELLDARDFGDLLQRYKFLSLVAERDAAMLDDVKRRRIEIQRQEAEITELLEQVTSSRREKEGELEQLRENEGKRQRALANLRKEKQRYQKRADELAKTEKELQNLMELLEKKRLEQAKEWSSYGELDFSGLKGKLLAPVDGRIVRQFGRFRHPEFGTVTFNTGVDIDAREGSPVRAVARGKIEYSSVLPGYGNCIIVNHGGGYYTLYAHTARMFVSQGDRIEKGHVIAETGERVPAAPDLFHFEIRKSKKALDPAEWLGR